MRHKTHCKYGHARTPANIDDKYMCRECRRERKRARRARDTRPKNPVKVAAGLAAWEAKRAKQAAPPAPVVVLDIDPAVELYRAEKARRRGAA